MKIFEKLGKRNLIIISIVLAVVLTASIVIPIVVINSKKCDHNYDILKYDATGHWFECKCGEKENFASHSPKADDGDCTTHITCESCDYVITEANLSHTEADDDGNCTTAVKCKNCEKNAVEAVDNHNDSDHDYLCDNPGCQVTVDGAPKDDNEGIDLPIDRN